MHTTQLKIVSSNTWFAIPELSILEIGLETIILETHFTLVKLVTAVKISLSLHYTSIAYICMYVDYKL